MDNQNETFELELPELTLTPDAEEYADPPPLQNPESAASLIVELTPEEKKMVADFSQKINIANSAAVLQYGNGAQRKVSDFSQNALSKVRSTDLDEVGKMVSELVTDLQGFNMKEEKGFLGLFKKAGNRINALKIKYDSMEKNVDKVCLALERHRVVLLKDIALLDRMYEMNLTYYKELSMYILAGRQKLQETLQTELPELQEKAKKSGRTEDAQRANDFAELCNRFDKRLHDLELTRMISVQMAPQIRLVQGNNNIMAEKIQSSLVNTIPLWKNQMVLAIGLSHTQQAINAQRQVTDMTNDLLRKNAETLKMSSIEAARESERSIVDIETLQYTNQQLISTLDEVLQIQNTGKAKRREAEVELGRIEDELKKKLLSLREDPQLEE